MDLNIEIAGIALPNPVMAASGTFGYGVELEDIINLKKLGAVVTKGLSVQPMAGNPSPRLFETAAGMLNSVGLQNIGTAAFIRSRLPRLRQIGARVIANVFGYTIEDYLEAVAVLNEGEGIAAYELNVSCPNTQRGGLEFGSDARLLAEVVERVKRAARRPVIVKLTPNVTRIGEMAQSAEAAGADALTVANTFLGMAIDPHTRRPRFANVVAGLSGPAIKPLALRMVWEAHQAVKIPVIGAGGIASGEDAVEFLLAGAAAVQVGTANFWDPQATENILRGLKHYGRRHSVARVGDLTGALERGGETGPAAGSQ